MKLMKTSMILIAAMTLAGCQSAYRNHAKEVANSFKNGDYQTASATAKEGAAKRADDETERVIYNLEAARTAQAAGDYYGSITHYDAVHEDLRPYLDTEAQYTVSEAVATTAVNQAMRTYRGTPGERIMASSMNSLNHLAVGDRDSARLELNRAWDWQQDAIKRYQKEIEAAQKKLEKEAEDEGVAGSTSRDIPDFMKSYYSGLDNMSGYADYRNPFASHLRGVYMLTNAVDDGDRDRARFDLRQAIQDNPNCEPALRDDLQLLEGSQRHLVPPITWIYFMTGRSPYYEELEIRVPIPSSQVPTAAAAFPMLKTHDDHLRYMEVDIQDGNGPIKTVQLVDMDSVVANEFNTRLPLIISQEIMSAAAKAAATYGMSEGMGDWGTLIGTVYQQATAEADLRCWQSMPKEIQVARVLTPQGGQIQLSGPGGRNLGTASVTPGESNIVVGTLPSAMAPNPSTMSLQLTGKPIKPELKAPEQAETPAS